MWGDRATLAKSIRGSASTPIAGGGAKAPASVEEDPDFQAVVGKSQTEAGIQMPENLGIKWIFSLAMQLLGFTYEAIRAQAVKRLGEEKVSPLEQTVDVFQVLASEGVAGIWEFVQEKMGDLNALVIEPIKNFIIEKVITAGVEWVIGLLIPGAGFIKAAKGIYEIVKFFIERAQQIADLINAILDAIGANSTRYSWQA